MKYLIYMRVSTEKQEDSGLGLEAQRHACMQWIEKLGGGEVEEFIDIVTGTDRKRKELEERPKLLEALSLLTKGDVLLVHKRERLARDPYIMGMIERIIEKKKAKLVSAIGEMEGEEPHNILLRGIMDLFAHYEALVISTRTKAALSRKKARGERLGHIPYGWMADRNGNLVVNLEERRAIDSIITLSDLGNTCRQIANHLNVEGYRNRSTKKRSNPLWTHGAVNRIYRNNIRFFEDAPSLQTVS
jgi:DNA invertase Pin-like site-specific DNA recombinase